MTDGRIGYKRAEVESLLKALQQSNIIIAKNIHKKFAHISLDSTQASKRALLEHYLNPVRTIEKLVCFRGCVCPICPDLC